MVKKHDSEESVSGAELEKFLLLYQFLDEFESQDEDGAPRDWLGRQEATFQALVDKLAREVPPETPI